MPKPTGKLGSFRVEADNAGNLSGTFQPVLLDKSKAAIELQIAERFIASMNRRAVRGTQFILSKPCPNGEDDFDLTVLTPRGHAYLELMEIAPLRGPYSSATGRYNPYDFARTIFTGVQAKSSRYSQGPGRNIYLLLYVTHWAFALSESVVWCLRSWISASPPVFSAVFLYHPLDGAYGIPYCLGPFPPEELPAFDPQQIRDGLVINLDPGGFTLENR
jgi:hypothetical protein